MIIKTLQNDKQQLQMRRSKQIKQSTLKQGNTSGVFNQSGIQMSATRGENFFVPEHQTQANDDGNFQQQLQDRNFQQQQIFNNFQNNVVNQQPAAAPSVSRNIQLLLQQSGSAIKSNKSQKLNGSLGARNNSTANISSNMRQTSGNIAQNMNGQTNLAQMDTTKPQFSNHRYSQYDIISHQKQAAQNKFQIAEQNQMAQIINQDGVQLSQRLNANNSLSQGKQGQSLQSNEELANHLLRGLLQSNSTEQIHKFAQNPQNMMNLGGISLLNPSTVGLNVSGHSGSGYNNTFVSPGVTRNEQLRSSGTQSNSVKLLPPQHPGTLTAINGSQPQHNFLSSLSHSNLQSAYLQQQKKLKVSNQKMKANVLNNLSSGTLQKSMSEFLRKSNDNQFTKLKVTPNQSSNGNQVGNNFTIKQNVLKQKQMILSKFQNKTQVLNHSLEDDNDNSNVPSQVQPMKLNDRLRNISLESNDNGIAGQNTSLNYPSLNHDASQNSIANRLRRANNSSLQIQDVTQASPANLRASDGKSKLSQAILQQQIKQESQGGNRNIRKILLSPEAQLNKILPLPPTIPTLSSSTSQQVLQFNNKKLEVANQSIMAGQSGRQQLQMHANNGHSQSSLNLIDSQQNSVSPSKQKQGGGNFFPAPQIQNENQPLPLVNRITPLNKLRVGQVTQQIASLSHNQETQDALIQSVRLQNQYQNTQQKPMIQNNGQANANGQDDQSQICMNANGAFQTKNKITLNQSLSAGKLKISQKIRQTVENANQQKGAHGGNEQANLKKDALKAQVISQFNIGPINPKGNQIKIKKNLIQLASHDNVGSKSKDMNLIGLATSANKKEIILQRIRSNHEGALGTLSQANLFVNSQKSLSILQPQLQNNISLGSPQQSPNKRPQAQALGKSLSRSQLDGSLSPPRTQVNNLATTQTFDKTASQIPNYSQASQIQNTSSVQLTNNQNITQITHQNQSSASLFDMRNQPSDNSKLINTQSSPTLSSVKIETEEWPISGEKACKKYRKHLTKFEQEEVVQFAEVFFVNTIALADEDFVAQTEVNNGYDDDQNYYRHRINEHIMYRYEILERLGRGSFGQVYKCFDHKLKEEVALKIIRNKHKFHKQALVELKILDHLRRHDDEDRKHVIKMKEAFLFRNHLCITFEMLNINLYQMIKACKFKGFDIKVVKNMALQLLITLRFLKKHSIIHCDLKPENILLKYYNKSMIKVIDFGSSCFVNERLYTYIQSRFYRSPEVILGLPYGHEIDIWSFGCIICELITGLPIFSGDSETEQMRQFIEILGLPSTDLLKEASRARVFFESDLKSFKFEKNKKRTFNNKLMSEVLRTDDQDCIDFVKKCFIWEPEKRLTPDEALNHPWLEETIRKIKK